MRQEAHLGRADVSYGYRTDGDARPEATDSWEAWTTTDRSKSEQHRATAATTTTLFRSLDDDGAEQV